MRIISGNHKGRRFSAPKNLPTRPTTDMAKEALFNILNNSYDFDQLNVIDLFAGIGSISLEFASRGVAHIISVDKHSGCIQFINTTAKQLGMHITTIKSDVFKFLETTSQRADIIFADPPYDFTSQQYAQLINSIFTKELLLEEGIFIIEHSKQMDLSSHKNFSFSKSYGGCVFSFFEV